MAKQQEAQQSEAETAPPPDEVEVGISAKLRDLDGQMVMLRARRRELVGALARYKGITVAALRDQMRAS